MNIYDNLEKLKKLLDDGAITQEEYEREKARLLSYGAGEWDFGIDEKSLAVLMHASQFISSFIAPLVIWLLFRKKSRLVDETGKDILNFQLSYCIYVAGLCLTCVGIALVPVVTIAMFVFIVIAVIKAINGESWKYPLSVSFLK
jgi:uncharacterized Tic20 family protein